VSSDRENETRREDTLFVLGRVAWRLAQVALVTAGVIVLFNVISSQRADDAEAIASMKIDLQNLVMVQEEYFLTNGRYGSVSSVLSQAGIDTINGSHVIGEATATGWRATATHSGARYRCGVFGGDIAPPRKGAERGIPECWKP